jgi:hypothetical protein
MSEKSLSKEPVSEATYKIALRDGDKIATKATEMLVLLHSAPMCIALIGDMIAMSTQAKVELNPNASAKFFTGTIDLKTGLLTIANNSLSAFNTSQINMKKISAIVKEIPEDVQQVTDGLFEATEQEEFDFVKEMTTGIVEKTTTAATLATLVEKQFSVIIDQLSELSETIMRTRGQNEGAAATLKARELADKFVEGIAKLREKKFENTVENGRDSNELEASITSTFVSLTQ